MSHKPEITKVSKEQCTCGYCGRPCWYQVVCSSCQVTLLIDIEEQHTWGFGYVSMWAKRLNRDVFQEVSILSSRVAVINTITNKFTVVVKFIDGSRTTYHASHAGEMTEAQANSIVAKLNTNQKQTLNGLHWNRM